MKDNNFWQGEKVRLRTVQDADWQRFYEEGLHKFLALEYAGDYETDLITEFEKFMPETPPWQR